MAEPARFTLDTSAVVAYLDDEPGAEQVERILHLAAAGRAEVTASFLTYMELLHQLWRRLGEREGKVAYLRLQALPVRRIDQSEALLLTAAHFKATRALSVVDAWVAATARLTASRLVHRDPEFRPLAPEVALLELPVKRQPRVRPR